MSPPICDEKYFNGEWVRKATYLEALHLKADLYIWYQLDLSSLEPLREEQVKSAVDHFYRKVPNLGVCFGKKDGEVWIKRATNPKVDFEVLRGLPLKEVIESLRVFSCKPDTGPLFCVRFLKESSDIEINFDLEPSFPHKSHVLFGFHHGTVDGTSNMHNMEFFISLLNDVISGKPIDEALLGTFVDDEETRRLVMQKKQLLEPDLELQKQIFNDNETKRTHKPLLISGFPAATEVQRTAFLVEVLDLSTTSKFVQRCRQEKVTVNSAFTAVCNVAMVDVLADYGNIQKSYFIQSFHAVNLRRYWDVKVSKALGCHIGYPLIMYADTPRTLEGKFWDYAASLGQALKKDVESGRILYDKAYKLLPSANTSESKGSSQDSNIYEGDFITSNMGDITTTVTKGGEKVRITNVVRGTTVHPTEYPVLINCHTFRGRFTIIYEYNTAVVQHQVAERITAQIVKRLREMAE